MRRHSSSILPAALIIFLAHGVAPAQDIRCGETLRRGLEQKFDRVSFNANANEVVSITVAAVADPVQYPNFDPEFQLQGPDGDAVRFTGAPRPRVCDAFSHQCETTPLPLDGTYTIVVNDTGKKQVGTYTVSVEAVSATAEGRWNGPPTAADPDAPFCKRFNDSGKADGTQTIDVGTPVGGVIDYPGETDTFTFLGASGRTVAVTIGLLTSAGGSFMPRARLFDPAGQPVGADCDLDEVCTRGPFAVDGVYTIKVFELSYDSTGDYMITVRDPDAPTTTTTTTSPTTPSDPNASTTTTTLPLPAEDPIYELSRTLRRTAILTPPEALGTAVAADDAQLLIGTPSDQTRGRAAGAAFLMRLQNAPPDPNYGTLIASFFRPDGSGDDDRFGAAVALLDGAAAVGAPGVDVGGSAGTEIDVGAVYLFNGSSAARISAPQPASGNNFGATVAALGAELFVGAPGQGGVGRVYLVSGGQVMQEFDPATAAPSDPPKMGDRFGAAIAAKGDFLAIGAPAPDSSREGRVYLFNRQSGVWRVLRSPTPAANDSFGGALAFVDSTLIIGAPGAGKLFRVQNVDPPVVEFGPFGFSRLGEALTPVPGGVLAGAPTAGDFPSAGGLVLRLDPNGVVLETYRKPEPEAADQYGTALAVNSTRVFVGVPGDDSGNVDAGAVYAYQLGVTTEEAIFRKRFVQAAFGTSIVADDATIAVGAPSDASGRGAVYAFDAQPTPCQGGVCVALGAFAGATEGSQFGQTVALVDGATLIGAPAEDVDGAADVGAAYLAVLGQAQRPRIADPETSPLAGDQFGFAVATIENDLLIGAPLLGSTDTGAVFVFDKRTQRQRLTLRNPVPTTGDFFGAAIAVEDDTIAVGAPFDGMAAWKAGAVYLFRRPTAELLEGKPLVSVEARERELFGAAVAMSAELIVVGAPSDDMQQPGRAYVFDRQSRGLLRIIENPNRAGAGDGFGAAVAIIEGRVLVGAPLTDAPATGAAAAAADAGAAYLFDPATGLRVQTFENPERGAFDRFGAALAPAPSGLLISAPWPGRVFVYRSVATSGLAVRSALGVTAAAPRCGNGIREGSEQCDDGNDVDTDGCTNECLPQCCVIDPLVAARCDDFDPCTDDSVDAVTGQCVNVDNGQCCTSDASCAGQDDVCRLCAGCSLFAWDCCDQGATCLVSSPECQSLPCFEKPLCECQGGLSCSEDGSAPTAEMDNLFLAACDALRQEDAPSTSDNPVSTARSYARQSRQALKDARRLTKRAQRDHTISKTCRAEYLETIRLVLKSIPGGNKLRTCARQKSSEG